MLKWMVISFNSISLKFFLNESVKKFFYKYNHQELNRPFQKHHVRNGFYEFNEIGKVENHLNLQIGSGVNKLFETLLNNKEINFKNRTRMLDVYRDNHVRYQNNESTLDEFLLWNTNHII